MSVRWQTLISDDSGQIDYGRVRSFVTVGLAALAGLMVLVAVIIEVGFGKKTPHDALLIMVTSMLAPLTGAVITERLTQSKAARASRGVPAVPDPPS
jgi:hypothetical protein